MAACPTITANDGVIRGVLQAVDCQTHRFARSGYEALAAPDSPFQAWLTALLIIYVAVLGYRMLFGAASTRLSDFPLTALKIGAVLALTANWSVFQTLVFDLASRAPIEIAQRATPDMNAGILAQGPLNGLQAAYDQITLAAVEFGRMAGPGANAYAGGLAGAAQALGQASQALLLTTAGLFAVAIAAVGVLTAVGPVFVALFLFPATRGLFVGWLRALLVAALAPMAGWMAASLMLVVIQPNLVELSRQRLAGQLDVDTAMLTASVVFVFAAVQLGLFAAGALIAISFRLPARRTDGPAAAPVRTANEEQPEVSRAANLAQFLRRAETGGFAGRAGAATPARLVIDNAPAATTQGLAAPAGLARPAPPLRRAPFRARNASTGRSPR